MRQPPNPYDERRGACVDSRLHRRRPPTLSVVVPATDSPPTLAACLAALRRSTEPAEQIIVVDRAPRRGAAQARNAGARGARNDVLVFVDADVEVHADALARIRTAFRKNDGLTAVFGSYDDRPADPRIVSTFRNLLHHHVHHDCPGPAATFWTGLGAMRRAAFERSGGFDEERFCEPSVEDVELGMRLAGRGARIELDPAIQCRHLKRWRLWETVRTDFGRRGVPWARLQLRTRRTSTALNLGWRHRLSAGACAGGAGGMLAGDGLVLGAPLVAVLTLLMLKHRFYVLLARHQGVRGALAGVALHALHHLVAVAALTAALVAHAAEATVRQHRRRRAAVAPTVLGEET